MVWHGLVAFLDRSEELGESEGEGEGEGEDEGEGEGEGKGEGEGEGWGEVSFARELLEDLDYVEGCVGIEAAGRLGLGLGG